MSAALSLAILFVALTTIHGLPVTSDSELWRKISKRDTAAVAPTIVEDKKTSNQSSVVTTDDKSSTDHGDELIETRPDSQASETEQSFQSKKPTTDDENDSSSERSIDWQLLSGNPADLERELESRRRRRSIRSSSLSRQHRIRTAGRLHRSRSKRDTYYEAIDPSDLAAAYAYLQSRTDDGYEDETPDKQPRIALLGDQVSTADLSDLASLIYELQHADDNDEDQDEAVVEDDRGDYDQQVLPGGYVDFEPTNDYETEVRITPEQLAALEQVLSEQPDEDEDEDGTETELFPKDKRSIEPILVDEENTDDQDDDEVDDVQPTYLIPATLDPSSESEYVQIPLASAYENPYDFYQVDDNEPSLYEEAVRRLDEEQLRQRIASLIEDINEQRQIARRRRR